MSLDKFWWNIRTNTRGITSGPVSDTLRIEPGEIEQALRNDTGWLSLMSLRGFDPDDFDFLPAITREELADAVERVRTIATRIAPGGSATEAQVEEALPAFARIVEILQFDVYADPQALRIGKLVEERITGFVPEFVADLRFETGEDVRGAQAIWIWVILKDEAATRELLGLNTKVARQLLTAAIRELDMDYWPYVSFRSVSELPLYPDYATR